MGKWKIVVRNGENRMICQKSWRHQYLHLQSDARVINQTALSNMGGKKKHRNHY